MTAASVAATATVPDDVIDRWVEEKTDKAGRHQARLTTGPRVWLVIGTLQRLDWDVPAAAKEWVIPEEAVVAAVRYYERHRPLFDAQLLLEAEESEW